MERGKLEPSIFIRREIFEELYSEKLKIIDFVVLAVLHERAKPTDGIATISYHGIGDLIGKTTNTIKNSIIRLVEYGSVIAEWPQTKGQKAFRVGVNNYYKKDKTYSSALHFKTTFKQDGYQNCKVIDEIAKSNCSELAKSKEVISPFNHGKEQIKIARSLIDNPAKPLDIDKDIEIEKEIEIDKEIKGNSDFKSAGDVLSSSFSFNKFGQSLGGGKSLGGHTPPYTLNGFDLAKHPDFRGLLNRHGEAEIIAFIERSSKDCRASSLGQAFGFVYGGLKRREKEGWT